MRSSRAGLVQRIKIALTSLFDTDSFHCIGVRTPVYSQRSLEKSLFKPKFKDNSLEANQIPIEPPPPFVSLGVVTPNKPVNQCCFNAGLILSVCWYTLHPEYPHWSID